MGLLGEPRAYSFSLQDESLPALRPGQAGTMIDSGGSWFQARTYVRPASLLLLHMGQNEDEAMVGYADLSAKLLSFVLQACETMPAAGGKGEAAGDAVEIGSSIVRAGLPTAGEAAPLLVAVALFIAAGAMILTRAERRNAGPEKAGVGANSQSALRPHLLTAGK